MGVRAIRVRIDCDRETLLRLWRTHLAYNEKLRSLVSVLFAMRRAEIGSNDEQKILYQRCVRFVLAHDAKEAVDLLNAVSIRKRSALTTYKKKAVIKLSETETREVTGEETFAPAIELASRGIFAYDKELLRDGLPDSMFQPIIRDAVACISSHDELTELWHKEHATWQARKAEWESDPEHQKYLALRPQFEAFEESAGGKAGKRRDRWHLYVSWLAKAPALAAWRGGPAAIHPLEAAAKARIAKAKPWKARSIEAEEFWKANPELRALDRLHGHYEREFVRRRKRKRNPDGFDHRPTFTQPHPVLHPRWTLFNAPQTSPEGYKDLVLPSLADSRGSLRLRLLTGQKAEDTWPSEWTTIHFRSDPRLANFVERIESVPITKGKDKGKTKSARTFRYIDFQLGAIERPAQISGAKLILDSIRLNQDGSLKSAIPYLVFACTIEDLPRTEGAKAIKWSEIDETSPGGKRRRSKKLPPGLISCAVDLGIRNLGFITIARTGTDDAEPLTVLRARNQWIGMEETLGKHPGRWSEGPELAHIGEHKRQIRTLRRQRGKPVKDESSHIDLQSHIDNMAEDRFKKAARSIVNLALNTDGAKDNRGDKPLARADILILERLAGFIPDAERQRGINRALVAWNRGQLVARIKEVAADAGLKVFEVHPAGTSQVCCKCGSLGRRYSIAHTENGRPVVRFGWVEKLFACPNPRCAGRAPGTTHRPFTCNADYNASVNLHRRFLMEGAAVQAFFDWRNGTQTERERTLAALDDSLRPALERLHGLVAPLPDTPF